LLLFGLLFGSCTSLNDNDGRKIEPLPENWTFTDLWYTRDQQGQRLLDKGEAPEALDKFEDPRQKAMILYHLDSLEDASAILTTIPSAESYFNQGVIQAQLKNWSSSKTAFEKAIDIKPDFKEAKENLDIILAIIEERKSRYVAPTSMEDKLYGRSEENQELQDMEGEMEETEGGKKEENAESAVSQSAPPQQDNILSGEMPQEQQQEEKDMVLRQLSDDPAEFLKRKFQHQVLTGKVKKTTLKEKW
jgi:Ca-activated chloride channel family protein